MVKSQDVQRWLQKKIINASQAQKIEKDLKEMSSERSSRRWLTAISVIGAILLGLAAILFISANWHLMSGGMKIFLAIVCSAGSLYAGWYLRYKTQTYVRIGDALLLLSTILIGGTYALISQVYHLDGEIWGLFFLWTLSVLPLAYLFRSKTVLRLGVLLLICTMVFFLSKTKSLRVWDLFEVFFETMPLFILSLLILFFVGSLHFLSPQWTAFGRVYRFVSLVLILFWMYIGTFYDGFEVFFHDSFKYIDTTKMFLALLLCLGVILWYGFVVKTDKKEKIGTLVGGGGLFVILLLSLDHSLPAEDSFFRLTLSGGTLSPSNEFLVVLINIWFIAVTIGLYYMGAIFEQMRLINLAVFATVIYIFGKYISLFIDMMSTSAFFFVGGGLLLTIAVFAERKRRDIRKSFNN